MKNNLSKRIIAGVLSLAMVITASPVFIPTETVKAAVNTTTIPLDVANGSIAISDSGYKQGDNTVTGKYNYVITGSAESRYSSVAAISDYISVRDYTGNIELNEVTLDCVGMSPIDFGSGVKSTVTITGDNELNITGGGTQALDLGGAAFDVNHDAKVKLAGHGTLTVQGRYGVGLGVGCLDSFTGSLSIGDSVTVNAGSTYAACIGASYGANVTGSITFKDECSVVTTGKNGGALPSGCAAIGYSVNKGSDTDATTSVNQMVLNFDGGTINIPNTSANAAGIGASSCTSNYLINISGSTIDIAQGANSIGIGGNTDADGTNGYGGTINISGGILNIKGAGYQPCIGDLYVNEKRANVIISGGVITLTKSSINSQSNQHAPIAGIVDISKYEDLNVTAGQDIDTAADILYDTYSSSIYFTTMPATTGYLRFNKCKSHSYLYEDSNIKTEHSRICKYCNRKAANEDHNYIYSVENNYLYEKCDKCDYRARLSVADYTTPYVEGKKNVAKIVNKGVQSPYQVTYGLNGNNFTNEAPMNVGNYVVHVSIGNVYCTGNITITENPMSLKASDYEGTYDGKAHSASITVLSPENATINYSNDGVNFSAENPSFTDVGNYTVYYKIECPNYQTVSGTLNVTITPKEISSVNFSELTQPQGNQSFDISVKCSTTGIKNCLVRWIADDTEMTTHASFNKEYQCLITFYPDTTGYRFSEDISKDNVSLSGSNPSSIKKNSDGSITAFFTFTTPKAKLLHITEASYDIDGLSNGVHLDPVSLGLSDTIGVDTEDDNITRLEIKWDFNNFVKGSYDPNVLTEQKFTLRGHVQVPDYIDASQATTYTDVNITVLPAVVKTPEANVLTGTYTEDKHVVLTCDTPEAEIHYTLDGTTPTAASPIYNREIDITGQEGYATEIQLKAVAFRDGLYDSGVATYTYIINKADTVAPTININVADRTWQDVIFDVKFGIFTTAKQSCNIEYSDNGTITSKKYYISSEPLKASQLVNLNDWMDYKGTIYLEEANKYIIYTRAEDEYKNVTYASSDGIVIYQNSQPETTQVNVIRGVTLNTRLYVKLMGNLVDSVFIDGTELADAEDYIADESSSSILLYSTAYNHLTFGDHTIRVTYKPQGEEYVVSSGNVEPAETTCTLSVKKPKLISYEAEQVYEVPNGATTEEIFAEVKPSTQIICEDPTITSTPVTWNKFTLDYDPEDINQQYLILTGTISDLNIDLNGKSGTVTAKVTVLPADACEKPRASVAAGSYDHPLSVSLSSPDNATIYYTTDGTAPTTSSDIYMSPINVDKTMTIKAICKSSKLAQSATMINTYTIYSLDATSPTGTISIGNESKWDKFFNKITFGFFTKEKQKVTIDSADPETGIKAVFYYVSDGELSSSDLAKLGGWELYTEPFYINPKSRAIVYAKIINGDDMYTYVNSNGVVVFVESQQVTDSVTYTKSSGKDAYAFVNLNGNSVSGISINNTSLKMTEQYAANMQGKITLLSSYLDTLKSGTYTVDVSYLPMAVDMSNKSGTSISPKNTKFNLIVAEAPPKQDNNNTGGSSSSGNSPSAGGSSSSGSNTSNNTSDLDGVSSKVEETPVNSKGEKKTVVTDKDKEGNTIVTTEVVSKDGKISTTVEETYKNGLTKTTVSSKDTSGNTYYHITQKNPDSSYYEETKDYNSDVETTDVYSRNKDGSSKDTYTTDKEISGMRVKSKIITKTTTGGKTSVTETYVIPKVVKGVSANIKVKRSGTSFTATANITSKLEFNSSAPITKDIITKLLAVANANTNSNPAEFKELGTARTAAYRSDVSNISVKQEVLAPDGKIKYKLSWKTSDIKSGKYLYICKIDNMGKNVMSGFAKCKVGSTLSVKPAITANATYTLMSKSAYKTFSNSIKAKTKLAKTSVKISRGKSVSIKLSSTTPTENIKKKSYRSSKKSVATVSSKGTVKGIKKGTAIISVKITYKDGTTKTLKEKVTVK